MCPQSTDAIRFTTISYFQRNRPIRFSVDCRDYIAESTFPQKVAVLINVLEFDSLSIASNYFKC